MYVRTGTKMKCALSFLHLLWLHSSNHFWEIILDQFLILWGFHSELLSQTLALIHSKKNKHFLRNYWGGKAGTWKMNFELLVEYINTEWHLLLHKCFSLLCNRSSVKNDTSKFVCHPLDCVSCQRPSLNLQNKMAEMAFLYHCSYGRFLDLF